MQDNSIMRVLREDDARWLGEGHATGPSDSGVVIKDRAILNGLRPDPVTRDRRAIARRLRCLRQAHMAMLGADNAGVEAFADIVGLPAAAIGDYESGTADPPTQALIQLHRATGASIDWLLTGADDGS